MKEIVVSLPVVDGPVRMGNLASARPRLSPWSHFAMFSLPFRVALLLILLGALRTDGTVFAQTDGEKDKAKDEPKAARKDLTRPDKKIKAYDDVVTKDAKSSKGLFFV